jgi:polyhydroxybutyrate depolymerase
VHVAFVRRSAALCAAALAASLLCACGVSASVPTFPKVARTAAQAQAPGDHTVTVEVQGRVRSLILHVPTKALAKRPLLLVFHGAEDTASGTEQSTDFETVSNKTGDLVAYLQGFDDTWNEGAGHTPAEQAGINDVAFTAAAIKKLETLVTFNHKRIVAVGFSNGALMVEDLGCHLAGDFALLVPVEGQLPVSVSSTCNPSRSVNVYEVHGTADASIPYNGGPFNGVGGGTTVLSAPASALRWATLDGCTAKPLVTWPFSTIKLTTYLGCKRNVAVTLRTIVNGTHQWGADIGTLVAEHVPAS